MELRIVGPARNVLRATSQQAERDDVAANSHLRALGLPYSSDCTAASGTVEAEEGQHDIDSSSEQI